MECKVTQEGDRVRFEINGEIDEQGAETLKSRFRGLTATTLKEVVLDFRNVSHIGSAGIGKLLLFYKDLAVNDGALRIVNTSSTITELFQALKLNTLFNVT
jgi:anti-anti-sigma factor